MAYTERLRNGKGTTDQTTRKKVSLRLCGMEDKSVKETTVPFQITKAEFQIMNVLWNSNQPLSYSDIINEISKVEELAFSKRSVFGMLVLVRVPPYPCQKSWHYITGEAYPTQAGHSIGIIHR